MSTCISTSGTLHAILWERLVQYGKLNQGDLSLLQIFMFFSVFCSTMTLGKVRRLIEKDLNLEDNFLNAHKDLVKDSIDKVPFCQLFHMLSGKQ